MKRWTWISLLLCLVCMLTAACAETDIIEILSPADGSVVNSADGILRLTFRVPESSVNDSFTYILTDLDADEVLDLDEIDADPADCMGVIGFDMSMFEKGSHYRIRLTDGNRVDLDASSVFEIGDASAPSVVEMPDEAEKDEPEKTEEIPSENDFVVSLISPADGEIVKPAETDEVQFRWILDTLPVSDVPYSWAVETADGEQVLAGSGRMTSAKKQYAFAVPVSVFKPETAMTFTIKALDEEVTTGFEVAKAPVPTPTPVVTATPEPQVTQEQLIASAASKLGIPASYISRVRMSGTTAYPFSAMIEGGTMSGDSSLRIVAPSNGAVMAYHESMFFEVKLEALKAVDNRLMVTFTDMVGNVLYILYYEKPIEAGKTASLAIPCRYFTPGTLICLSIDSADAGDIHGETRFSFRIFEPTPVPTAAPTPTAAPAESAKPAKPVETAASTPEPTAEPTPAATPEPSPASTPDASAPVEEVVGRIQTSKDGYVNIRSLPDKTSEKIGTVRPGTILNFTGVAENGWYRVVLANGKVGYVSSKLCRRLRK
ncbi:MAG: SH3 domain-containing protein [Clostridia bacterium]|nr:SH3 domain-containing protein [Clostridia bacterium]